MSVHKFIRLKQLVNRYFRLVVMFLTGLLLISLLGNIVSIRKSQEKISEAKERVSKLKQERIELEKKLSLVDGEFYIERQLRDSLGLAREDEIVLVLPDDKQLRRLAPAWSESTEELPDPNWKKWMDLFM